MRTHSPHEVERRAGLQSKGPSQPNKEFFPAGRGTGHGLGMGTEGQQASSPHHARDLALNDLFTLPEAEGAHGGPGSPWHGPRAGIPETSPPPRHLPHGLLLADASEHGQGPRPVSPGQDYPALLSNLSAPSPHPTPRSLPTSFPPKHSLIHSPDHLQTTHLPGPHSSCPAQLPGIMAAPPPPSQDPPPSLITTLAPPG